MLDPDLYEVLLSLCIYIQSFSDCVTCRQDWQIQMHRIVCNCKVKGVLDFIAHVRCHTIQSWFGLDEVVLEKIIQSH